MHAVWINLSIQPPYCKSWHNYRTNLYPKVSELLCDIRINDCISVLLVVVSHISYFSVLSTIDKRLFIIIPSKNVACSTQPYFACTQWHCIWFSGRQASPSFVKFLIVNEDTFSLLTVTILTSVVWPLSINQVHLIDVTCHFQTGWTPKEKQLFFERLMTSVLVVVILRLSGLRSGQRSNHWCQYCHNQQTECIL